MLVISALCVPISIYQMSSLYLQYCCIDYDDGVLWLMVAQPEVLVVVVPQVEVTQVEVTQVEVLVTTQQTQVLDVVL